MGLLSAFVVRQNLTLDELCVGTVSTSIGLVKAILRSVHHLPVFDLPLLQELMCFTDVVPLFIVVVGVRPCSILFLY